MSPLTTITDLQSLLGWRDVVEEQASDSRVFGALPSRKALPRIEFVFDGQVTSLHALGFGRWHGHYDRWEDERRNFRRAVAVARALIAGERCLLVEWSQDGKYLGSGIYRGSKLPQTLSRGFARLERFTFNAPPADVPIDLSKYQRTKSGSYIEPAWRERVKQAYAGTPAASWFD
jgi:hypothetical protein